MEITYHKQNIKIYISEFYYVCIVVTVVYLYIYSFQIIAYSYIFHFFNNFYFSLIILNNIDIYLGNFQKN